MRALTRSAAIGVIALLLCASAAAAQEHSYTQADIEEGARLYQSSCAGCHGPSGDMVPGIELQAGRFRRATSDTEIMRIIQSGIPGTTMPPSSFSEAQAGTIVAFLRSAAPAAAGGTRILRGDPGKGRAVFEGKGRCATCHRVNGIGPRVAPDLSDVGAIRPVAELEQKLLDPNALVRPANRFVELVMKDGTKVTGHLLNQDTFSIQLLDSKERLLSVAKSDLRDYSYVRNSPMPAYRDVLSTDELTDLITYLVSLKGERR